MSNRLLPIGLYGVLAFSTYSIYLGMYVGYERHGSWSDPLSVFVGIVEVISLAALWVSFAASAFYRRWTGRARTSAWMRTPDGSFIQAPLRGGRCRAPVVPK